MSSVPPAVQSLHDAIYTLPGVAHVGIEIISLSGISMKKVTQGEDSASFPLASLYRTKGGAPDEQMISIAIDFTRDNYGWVALEFLAWWTAELARQGEQAQMRPFAVSPRADEPDSENRLGTTLHFVIEVFVIDASEGGDKVLTQFDKLQQHLNAALDTFSAEVANPVPLHDDPLDALDWDEDEEDDEEEVWGEAEGDDADEHEHGCDHSPEELRADAEAGDPHAQFHLAQHLENGDYGDADPTGAFELYAKSAAQGYPPGMLLLGRCYEEGVGCAQDPHEAIKYYRAAADADFPVAMAFVGKCYEEGVGVPRDAKSAARWYKKGAELQDPMCQAHMGECYEQGIGVKGDLKEALRWYKAAFEQGLEELAEAITRVELEMS